MEETLPKLFGTREKVCTLEKSLPKAQLSKSLFESVESWSSEESRSIETGKSFLEGLEMDPESIVVDNSKAVYYKGEFGCERYVQEVRDKYRDNAIYSNLARFMTMMM